MMSGHKWKIAVRVAVICCVLSACGTHKSERISSEQRLHVANAAESSGDTILARSMYAAAAAEGLDNRTVQIKAAEGLVRTGAPADAMVLLNAVLQRTPDDEDVRLRLGSLQIVNGQPAAAVQNLSKVYAVKPEDDKVRIDLGVALDMVQRHADAEKLYRAVLARHPMDTDAANDLALSLVLSGQSAAARSVLLPFRGRTDLPERMVMTMRMADEASRNTGGPRPNATAPTSLNARSRKLAPREARSGSKRPISHKTVRNSQAD